jgi:hypothetical protein
METFFVTKVSTGFFGHFTEFLNERLMHFEEYFAANSKEEVFQTGLRTSIR